MRASSALLLGLLWAFAANAQCPPPPPPLAEGEIGLFTDPAATQNCVAGPLFSVPLYVIARVPEGGVAEFEVPTLLQTFGQQMFLPRTAFAPGYEIDGAVDTCPSARRIDPSSCPVAQGDLLLLVVITMHGLPFSPIPDGTYCFSSACESIGGVVARATTYRRCDDGSSHEFAGGASMCIGVFTPTVAAQPATWGTVKALYE